MFGVGLPATLDAVYHAPGAFCMRALRVFPTRQSRSVLHLRLMENVFLAVDLFESPSGRQSIHVDD